MNHWDKLYALSLEIENELKDVFASIDETAFYNQKKVLDAFREEQLSDADFMPGSGYGYDDRGRDKLERIYARVFGCEAALVRHQIVSGTHALTIGLFGLLRPGDTMLVVSGKPYDTLSDVIGLTNNEKNMGSLNNFGVNYQQIDLLPDGSFDYPAIEKALLDKPKMVYLQRSRGYADRPTLTPEGIGELVHYVKSRIRTYVVVDNCYGEFCRNAEPTHYGADLIIGSLIKNPGGGMAESGGYLAGTKEAIDLCSYRMSCPGLGNEVGAGLGQTKSMIKGLFFSPHVTAQALKTAVFAAAIFEKAGFDVSPKPFDTRNDIIQSIRFDKPEALIAFCRGIQSASPVDSHVVPEPWDMPGYNDPVIMAAGAFTQGSSIELSADGPIRPPYIAFLQGGLTYESGKLAILSTCNLMKEV